MKRKLIKRNKGFLSSRYRHSYGGNGSFQAMLFHKGYIGGKTNKMKIGYSRYKWMWFYKGDYLDAIFKDIDTEEYTGNLAEISAIDQELGLI